MSTLLKSPINSRMRINVADIAARDASVSFKKAVLDNIGDLKDFSVLSSNVLVATYVKPEKTAGGIIIPDTSKDEDRWQGKVGLVLKIGESAFKYDGAFEYEGTKPKIGDYVVFHTSDSREIGVNGFSCRFIDSSLIRMVIPERAVEGIY